MILGQVENRLVQKYCEVACQIGKNQGAFCECVANGKQRKRKKEEKKWVWALVGLSGLLGPKQRKEKRNLKGPVWFL